MKLIFKLNKNLYYTGKNVKAKFISKKNNKKKE